MADKSFQTPTSEQLCQWDIDHFWHAFTPMASYTPLVIDRAQGVWLYDTEGNRYLDGVSSMWCNLLGHRQSAVDAAIRDQLDRVAHSTSLGMANTPAVVLAKRLADLAPGDLQHVFYASDGSSAVEVALKMAYQYWQQCEKPQPQKTKYIALGQAYHGDTIGSASVGGIERFHALFKPLLFDVLRLPIPDPRRLPPETSIEEATQHFLAELEQVLIADHQQVAALVVEPLIQAAAGMVFHAPGYLRGVRELTDRYDVLLIADEIVTGFGRTGQMFACQHEQVTPDFLCLGKSITGGYLPLAATIASPNVYSAFLGPATNSFLHGHTYGGNPLAAVAALATLDLLQDQDVIENFNLRTEQLAAILKSLQNHPHVAETRQMGLIAAVELTSVAGEHQSYPIEVQIAAQVCKEMLHRGVWIRPLRDVLVIMPPLSITADELQLLGDVLLESIETVTQSEASVGSPT
ncbi:MAG: adenosylmethionine--8-amino-7-oxononanoate transaminase [Planctomycetales bacterium]|nr:adenosylmethionine--8-amino-7-oxononanoate transaminase [Planctomycetales bacterium]